MQNETIPSKNVCKTFRYYNASLSPKIAFRFSGETCCLLRYEIPEGMSGYFPANFLSQHNIGKTVFDLYNKNPGESEVILHPFIKFEITNIKFGRLDVTDDIFFVNNSIFENGNYSQDTRDRFIIHLRAVGYHNVNSFKLKDNWEIGDIINVNLETLQKNYCIAPKYVARLKISEDDLLFRIKKIEDNKFFSFKKNYHCEFVQFSSTDNTYIIKVPSDFRDIVWNDPKPPNEIDFNMITIQKDDSCPIIFKKFSRY